MTKSTIDVSESVKEQVLGSVTGKNKWRVRLIAAGAGSSGFYTEEVLRRDGPEAWPVGTLSHIDHQTLWERDERPEKSLKSVAGVVSSTPVYEGDGLYADMEFTEDWAPFIEQLHEHIGVSISAKGVVSEEESSEGLPIVERLLPYPTNSVDIVTAAGAGGKFSHILEQFRDKVSTEERKDQGMTPEEIQKIGAALAESLVPLLKPDVEETENEQDELDLAVVTEAVIEADLPGVARKQVYEAVRSGRDLDEAVKEQKDLIEALQGAMREEVGVLQEAKRDTEPADYSVGVWN